MITPNHDKGSFLKQTTTTSKLRTLKSTNPHAARYDDAELGSTTAQEKTAVAISS
eukprot:SAG31_NODE_113_length_24342_cov_5.194530_4_plen_55_part_00